MKELKRKAPSRLLCICVFILAFTGSYASMKVTKLQLSFTKGKLLLAFNRATGMQPRDEEYVVKYEVTARDNAVCTEDDSVECTNQETFDNKNEIVLHHIQVPYDSEMGVSVKPAAAPDADFVTTYISSTIGVPSGPPIDVRITESTPTSAKLAWKNATPLPGSSNYQLTATAHFTEEDIQQVSVTHTRNEVKAESTDSIDKLKAEYGYYITVAQITDQGTSPPSKPIFLARKPVLSAGHSVGPVANPNDDKSFYIYNPCHIIGHLVDMRGGPVESVNLYVREKGDTTPVDENVKWMKTFASKKSIPPYLAATVKCEKTFSNFLCKTKNEDEDGRSLSSEVKISKRMRYTIGNEDCSAKKESDTCNGPLPAGKSYEVAYQVTRLDSEAKSLKSDVSAFSEVVVTGGDDKVVVAPAAGNASSGLGVGDILAIIFGSIILLLLLFLLLYLFCPCVRRCCCCCFWSRKKRSPQDEEQAIEPVVIVPQENERAIALTNRLEGLLERMEATDLKPRSSRQSHKALEKAYEKEKKKVLECEGEYDSIVREHEKQKPRPDKDVEKLQKVWIEALLHVVKRILDDKQPTYSNDDLEMTVLDRPPKNNKTAVVTPVVAEVQENLYDSVDDDILILPQNPPPPPPKTQDSNLYETPLETEPDEVVIKIPEEPDEIAVIPTEQTVAEMPVTSQVVVDIPDDVIIVVPEESPKAKEPVVETPNDVIIVVPEESSKTPDIEPLIEAPIYENSVASQENVTTPDDVTIVVPEESPKTPHVEPFVETPIYENSVASQENVTIPDDVIIVVPEESPKTSDMEPLVEAGEPIYENSVASQENVKIPDEIVVDPPEEPLIKLDEKVVIPTEQIINEIPIASQTTVDIPDEVVTVIPEESPKTPDEIPVIPTEQIINEIPIIPQTTIETPNEVLAILPEESQKTPDEVLIAPRTTVGIPDDVTTVIPMESPKTPDIEPAIKTGEPIGEIAVSSQDDVEIPVEVITILSEQSPKTPDEIPVIPTAQIIDEIPIAAQSTVETPDEVITILPEQSQKIPDEIPIAAQSTVDIPDEVITILPEQSQKIPDEIPIAAQTTVETPEVITVIPEELRKPPDEIPLIEAEQSVDEIPEVIILEPHQSNKHPEEQVTQASIKDSEIKPTQLPFEIQEQTPVIITEEPSLSGYTDIPPVVILPQVVTETPQQNPVRTVDETPQEAQQEEKVTIYQVRIYREEKGELQYKIETTNEWISIGKRWTKRTAQRELKLITMNPHEINYFFLIPYDKYHIWKESHFVSSYTVITDERGYVSKNQFFDFFEKLSFPIDSDDLVRVFELFKNNEGFINFTTFFQILLCENVDKETLGVQYRPSKAGYKSEVRRSITLQPEDLSRFVSSPDGSAKNLNDDENKATTSN